MPRKGGGRGGARQLPAGKVSANRTDLNQRQPVRVAPGGVYGSRVASEDAQRAVPLPQAAPAGGGARPPIPPAAPPAAPDGPDAGRPTPPHPLAPTRRPNEPVTAGIDSGPGAGSESLGLPQQPDMGRLAAYLPVLEILASQPNATEDTRNFVRLVRANIPLGV